MCFINRNVLDGLVEGSILVNSSSEACEVTLMWHELFGGAVMNILLSLWVFYSKQCDISYILWRVKAGRVVGS
jgi:hypothetical protein